METIILDPKAHSRFLDGSTNELKLYGVDNIYLHKNMRFKIGVTYLGDARILSASFLTETITGWEGLINKDYLSIRVTNRSWLTGDKYYT
jgi:hypothetical protein